jgi:hypothetical protein
VDQAGRAKSARAGEDGGVAGLWMGEAARRRDAVAESGRSWASKRQRVGRLRGKTADHWRWFFLL